MGIKMVDTAEPMNENGYPVARAKHIWFDDSESLQKKLDNGSLSGDGSGYTQLSQAEYDALSDDEKMNGKEYRTYDTGHIYKLGIEYGKDAYFTSLEQLGLTGPTTVGEVFVAMPNKSMLMLNVEALVDDGTNTQTVIDVPKDYGILTIEKYAPGRHRIEYSSSLGGSSSDVRKWIGSIKGNDGTGLRWIELTGSAKIYTTMAELGLDGATATVQDVMDAISVGEIAMLRTDAFNNDNWKTQCNNIQYGYLKIEKTINGLCNIELQEVVAPNRRYFGRQSGGQFAGWTQATNARGLVSNAQNFKLDLTKNNPSWYGFVKLEYLYGNNLCEICIGISSTLSYTVTKGKNLIDKITYTINGANIVIGIDFISKVYGTQVIEMPSEFGVVNSLTAETFTGDTVASQTGVDLELTKGTKVVTEIGKSTYAVVQKILQDTDFTTTDRQARFEIVTKNVESSTNGKHQTAQLYQMTPIDGGVNASIQYIVYENGKAQLTMYPHTNTMPRNDYNIVCEGYLNSKLDNLIYNSVAELNRAKGTNIELVNGEDNTQKIVDALNVGEQFISLYHNNANQNRFGIDVSYGNIIHELRITKCLDADLTANYATVTAFMNTGCVMSRIFYKTYSTAWSSTKDYVESLT